MGFRILKSRFESSWGRMIRVRRNVSLKQLGTFRIGGKVRGLVTAKSPEELVEAVQELEGRGEEYRVFAGGSNIVFPDEGLDLTLVRFLGGDIKFQSLKVSKFKRTKSERVMVVDGGVFLSDVIEKSTSLGFMGLETLSGIPGTVGGAIVGNAGAYGRSISEVVEKVEVFDGERRRWVTKGQCKFGYRDSVFKYKLWIVLRAALVFKKGDVKKLREVSREIVELRGRKYKPGLRCPGSFFKNVLVRDVGKKVLSFVDPSKIIEGKIPAGWLLESVDAKGMRVGGIQIADFHGNLFINCGGGTAEDVKKLARALKKKVRDRFGIALEEEIRYF